MKPTLFLALGVLLAASGPCFAEIAIEKVSRERARELGIHLRAKPNGPAAAWIELEFKPAGALQDFQHVSLEIADDKAFQLGWTPLKDQRTPGGAVLVRLMASRAFLDKVTLRIVTGRLGQEGYDLRLADWVEPVPPGR